MLLLANDLTGCGEVNRVLSAASCRVVSVDSASRMIDLARVQAADLAVIDLRPDLLGYEAICALRAAGSQLPIMFISARSAPDARSQALALGADDVVVLPFSQHDIAGRIARLVQRLRYPPRSVADGPFRITMRVGRLEMDFGSRCARVGDTTLDLTHLEFATLELLATRNGAAVRRETILQRLQDVSRLACTAPLEPAMIDGLVRRMRRVLTKAGAGDLIGTVRGLGFAMHEITTPVHWSTS